MQLTLLDPYNPQQPFPPLEQALTDPNGLLAVGGCLSPQRIVNAYRQGIFPWFNPDEPLLWWSPNPRLVLFPKRLVISASLKKKLRKGLFTFTLDRAFPEVIARCAAPRPKHTGTWITDDMTAAYVNLHEIGVAHSVEAWLDEQLVGGLYGLAIGRVFFGESMFHSATDASKAAFAYLVAQLIEWDYQLIDCQVYSAHLASLGAEEIDRRDFAALLETLCLELPASEAWQAP